LFSVLTNYATADYEERSAQLGADRFFDKSLETGSALAFIGAQAAAACISSALRT